MKFVDSASSSSYAAGGSKSTKFCIDPAVLKHSPLCLGLAVATNVQRREELLCLRNRGQWVNRAKVLFQLFRSILSNSEATFGRS